MTVCICDCASCTCCAVAHGINLIAANHIIFVDPVLDPSVEAQVNFNEFVTSPPCYRVFFASCLLFWC